MNSKPWQKIWGSTSERKLQMNLLCMLCFSSQIGTGLDSKAAQSPELTQFQMKRASALISFCSRMSKKKKWESSVKLVHMSTVHTCTALFSSLRFLPNIISQSHMPSPYLLNFLFNLKHLILANLHISCFVWSGGIYVLGILNIIHIHTYVFVKINKNTNLKDNHKGYMVGLEGRKGREK